MLVDSVLFIVHYTILLLFGILLSAAFAGVQPGRRTLPALLACFTGCGVLLLITLIFTGEAHTWKLYPVIVHLPLILLLHWYFHKRLTTVFAAVSTAYLFCQPAKWIGLFISAVTASEMASQITSIITFLVVGVFSILFLAPSVSALFAKENRNVLIFGMVPMVYYLFDYSMGIYTDLWTTNNRTVVEFLPFFLSIVYMVFCFTYYKEYEQKSDAERSEQVIRLMLAQQTKEIEALKRSEQEIRLLRHDMRLHLNHIALSIEHGDLETAKNAISGISSQIDSTVIHRYCEHAAINYILSGFAAKCAEAHIEFTPSVHLTGPVPDEVMFASILSNALDNAYNAQQLLPEENRKIKLLLKHTEKKLLLSVKNPLLNEPTFRDGLPVSNKPGHGYGTQSIRYMAERLGGDCQFMVQDHMFVLRVMI